MALVSIHSFIYVFNIYILMQQILSTCSRVGAMLGAGNTELKKIKK